VKELVVVGVTEARACVARRFVPLVLSVDKVAGYPVGPGVFSLICRNCKHLVVTQRALWRADVYVCVIQH
jgi:hypothetical protein